MLVAGPEQVALVAGDLEPAAAAPGRPVLARAATLVVPRAPRFTVDLGGPPAARQTVGVRWPDHPVVVALCERARSAGRHQRQPARCRAGHHGRRGGCRPSPEPGSPEVVLDGGRCDGVPSTVVECRGPASRCLREGALAWADLSEVGRAASDVDGGSGADGDTGVDGAGPDGGHLWDAAR